MIHASEGVVTGAGIEPAARALKVRCSTTELPSPLLFAQKFTLYLVCLKADTTYVASVFRRT